MKSSARVAKQAVKRNEVKIEPFVPPICPHCDKPLERVEWYPYANGKVAVVYHDLCRKVIGTNVIPAGLVL